MASQKDNTNVNNDTRTDSVRREHMVKHLWFDLTLPVQSTRLVQGGRRAEQSRMDAISESCSCVICRPPWR